MVLDGQRGDILDYEDTVFGDQDARKVVDGVAVHWYWDNQPPEILTQAHEMNPDKFILYTEVSTKNAKLVKEFSF